MGRILVSPLNWGLGHATRDIPIIHELLRKGHEVTIAATGNALYTLRREFPDIICIDAPDYAAPYGPGNHILPRILRSLPDLYQALAAERRCISRILARDRYDLIISDNRLGMYGETIPSLFITHQLHFHFPASIWPAEIGALVLNKLLHRKYTGVIVPDNPPGSHALAGKLSRPILKSSMEHCYFTGILATAQYRDLPQDLDYLFIISGPEPQRTIFERNILSQIPRIPGSKVILLGSPAGNESMVPDPKTIIISYADTEEKIALLNRARFIVCRSGYTTMMELAEIQKKKALFVPTPGQTEQEYLSDYYRKKGWYYSQTQGRLDLKTDIQRAEGFLGFPNMGQTEQNAQRLYREVLSVYVE